VTEERVLKVTGERVGVVRELAGIQALLDGSPRRDLSDGAERSGVGLQNFSYFCRLQRVDIDLVEIKTEIPKFHPRPLCTVYCPGQDSSASTMFYRLACGREPG
jgi:hypothetical protein